MTFGSTGESAFALEAAEILPRRKKPAEPVDLAVARSTTASRIETCLAAGLNGTLKSPSHCMGILLVNHRLWLLSDSMSPRQQRFAREFDRCGAMAASSPARSAAAFLLDEREKKDGKKLRSFEFTGKGLPIDAYSGRTSARQSKA